MNYVLWLPSWYPNKLAPFDGDFIQRHAKAVARFQKITVIHIKKDDEGKITKEVKAFSSSQNNLDEIIIFYHPAKTNLGFLNRLLSAIKYRKVYRQALKKYMEENGKPDIVHVHVALKAGIQALFLNKKLRTPYIVSEHWSGYYANAKVNIYNSGFLLRNLTKKILLNASLLLPVTKNMGEIINNKIVEIPFEVVANVVDTSSFFYHPCKHIKFRFIHASSLNYYKNPEGIIRAVKQLADEGVNFELIFIGWVTKPLVELADKLLLTDKYIFFKSPITYEEVAKEMQQASSLILFSRIESLPCIMLEALCCGLPVISTNVGGINEVINKTNGILVESENEEQLANAMKKMILNYNSYNKIEIAKNATNEFSYDAIGKKIYEIYNKHMQTNVES